MRRQARRQSCAALPEIRNRTLACGDGGALGGTRTPNLLIRSQMLYPLSYERSWCVASLRRTGGSLTRSTAARRDCGDVSSQPWLTLAVCSPALARTCVMTRAEARSRRSQEVR